MTQMYAKIYASDLPATGDETPERAWALKASFAMSAIWILFSFVAWTWANGQRIDYSDLDTDQIMGKNGFGYLGLYLGGMFTFGVASLWLALAGAGSTRRAPWVAVIAGAMAMFLVMVPFIFFVDHGISHWYTGD